MSFADPSDSLQMIRSEILWDVDFR
jgi:hypothetical protein